MVAGGKLHDAIAESRTPASSVCDSRPDILVVCSRSTRWVRQSADTDLEALSHGLHWCLAQHQLFFDLPEAAAASDIWVH